MPRVWAVGGGKGGVGKSVVTSSLALSLSSGGPHCAIVDADLGGANLHTLLGVARPRHTLGDFMDGRLRDLSQVLAPTSIPGLSLVSGARAVLEMANPKHAQKQKLLRHLRMLDVTHVLVDLGAGTSFNTLDPFVAADERLLVVCPEPTSIENAYHFLKAGFFRSLREVARGEHREVMEEVMATARRQGLSPREMVDLASRRSPEAGRAVRQCSREFAPKLIVNRCDTADDRRVGHEMVATARRHLGVVLHYVGALDMDAAVPLAVTRQQPVLHLFPGCAFSKSMLKVVERIRTNRPLGPESAPPRWRVRPVGPPVATHGVAEVEVALPKLKRRASAQPLQLPPIDLAWPGRSLRRCREHLDLSLREMEERTMVRCIEDIEAERFAELPPEPYLASYVRAYVEALGIPDGEVLVTRFLNAAREARPEPARGILARIRKGTGIQVLPRRLES